MLALCLPCPSNLALVQTTQDTYPLSQSRRQAIVGGEKQTVYLEESRADRLPLAGWAPKLLLPQTPKRDGIPTTQHLLSSTILSLLSTLSGWSSSSSTKYSSNTHTPPSFFVWSLLHFLNCFLTREVNSLLSLDLWETLSTTTAVVASLDETDKRKPTTK